MEFIILLMIIALSIFAIVRGVRAISDKNPKRMLGTNVLFRSENAKNYYRKIPSKDAKFIEQCPNGCAPVWLTFRYEDGEGNETRRDVSVIAYGYDYFGGYCHKRKALRTFKFERVVSDPVVYENQEAIPLDELFRFFQIGYDVDISSLVERSIPYGGGEVGVVGLGPDDEKMACSIAENKGIKVRKTVAKNITLLCAGYSVKDQFVMIAKGRSVPIVSLRTLEILLNIK